MTIVPWNAEGLRTKVQELGSWLPAIKADVVAIQEAQLPKAAPSIPGFQPPVVVRRARGRRTGAASVKGGDVALYVRAGLHFVPLSGRYIAATDDSTELCGVRLLGPQNLDVLNIYRLPIRATGDDREDRFDPGLLPCDDASIIVGDVNAHHPRWDRACDPADAVGERVAAWMETVGWVPLNSGEATFASYRSGAETAPDLAACSAALARRARWLTGPDLGSDHLPMVVEIRAVTAPPRRIRKAKWAYHKAEWAAFRDDCERALAEPGPQPPTAQRLTDRFEEVQPSNGLRLPAVDGGGWRCWRGAAPGVRGSQAVRTSPNGVQLLPTCGTPRRRRPAAPPSRGCCGGLGGRQPPRPPPPSTTIDYKSYLRGSGRAVWHTARPGPRR